MGLFVAGGVSAFSFYYSYISHQAARRLLAFGCISSSSSSSFFVQSRGKDSAVESLLLVRISGGIISLACKFTQLLLLGGWLLAQKGAAFCEESEDETERIGQTGTIRIGSIACCWAEGFVWGRGMQRVFFRFINAFSSWKGPNYCRVGVVLIL